MICLGVLSSFKKAFGHERVDAHADSDDELLYAVRRQWELIQADSDVDSSSRHQYMVCSSVSSAPSMLSVLSKHLDESNYHILLQSVNMDSTCYSVAGTLREVSLISRDGARTLRYVSTALSLLWCDALTDEHTCFWSQCAAPGARLHEDPPVGTAHRRVGGREGHERCVFFGELPADEQEDRLRALGPSCGVRLVIR